MRKELLTELTNDKPQGPLVGVVSCVNLIEWRDSQLQCVKGVTGVSPGEEEREALCIQRGGQSAIDTDPGDTIKTGLFKRQWQTQFESDIHTSAFELKTPHTLHKDNTENMFHSRIPVEDM